MHSKYYQYGAVIMQEESIESDDEFYSLGLGLNSKKESFFTLKQEPIELELIR